MASALEVATLFATPDEFATGGEVTFSPVFTGENGVLARSLCESIRAHSTDALPCLGKGIFVYAPGVLLAIRDFRMGTGRATGLGRTWGRSIGSVRYDAG